MPSAPAPDWDEADRAYRTHHFACPICCAAGIGTSASKRCPEGQALWDTYQQAGTPPHFLWIKPHVSSKNQRQRPPQRNPGQ